MAMQSLRMGAAALLVSAEHWGLTLERRSDPSDQRDERSWRSLTAPPTALSP